MLAEFPAPGNEPAGGPQVAVGRLVRKLAERGAEVVIVSPDAAGSSETVVQLADGTTHVSVPAGQRLTLVRGMRLWRRNATAVVARLGADVIHGQGVVPGGIAAADLRASAPIVVTARGNARKDTEAAYTGVNGSVRAYLRDRLAGIAVANADVVIGVNPDWTVNMPVPPKRFRYIPNMIEEFFFAREREPDAPRVLFAGGTRAIKGWPLLAQAWPRVLRAVPEARLQVVNWPPAVTPAGIPSNLRDSVAVEGPLSSLAIADWMARSSVLAIPSEYEVSPVVLAEAWAVGLPVVASPVGGIPALATGAAILAERDPEMVAAGIVSALAGGPEIDDMVVEGRRRAEAHRPDAVVSAHEAVYEELTRAPRTPAGGA